MGRKFRPVFTLPGLCLLVIALVVLVRSLALRNSYEILLSSAALLFLAVLGAVGAWGARRLLTLEPHWKPPLPLTAASEEDWLVTSQVTAIPLFFRLHFLVKGRFFPQGSKEACPVFSEASLARGADSARLSFGFPLGGYFLGEFSCRLKDMFGLFSFPCGQNRTQSYNVRSSPCNAKQFKINTQSGAEDRHNKSSSDEERYYMREYTPGDRLRDINWKSSERIDTLITRISPDSREKVSRIEIFFRNYGPVYNKNKSRKERPTIEELWFLDRAKARIAWFLRSVNEENASYIFHIRTALDTWELGNQEEIESFLEELAAVSFSPPQNEDIAGVRTEGGTGELYVFSTACDSALPAFLLARQDKPLTLFLVQGAKAGTEGSECLRLRDFLANGSFPLICWLQPGKGRQLRIPGSRFEIDYAEIRL